MARQIYRERPSRIEVTAPKGACTRLHTMSVRVCLKLGEVIGP
jgi:hypothetical protein